MRDRTLMIAKANKNYCLLVAMLLATLMSTSRLSLADDKSAGSILGQRVASSSINRIYLGLMDADYTWHLVQTPENIVRYSWRAEESGGANSPNDYVGISPVGYLENGEYHQLRPNPITYTQRARQCDAIRERKAVSKCYTALGNDLFPELAPITSIDWFYRGAKRRTIVGAVPVTAVSSDFDDEYLAEYHWRTFFLISKSFFTIDAGAAYAPQTVGFRGAFPPWLGDVVSTSAGSRSHPLVPSTDSKVNELIIEEAKQAWIEKIAAFRQTTLPQLAPDVRPSYEKNLQAAVTFLKNANLKQPPFVCVMSPGSGKYANRLYTVVWGSNTTSCGFNPADTYSIGHSDFKLTATVMRGPSGYHIQRIGLSVKDEIQYLQTAVGSVLESPQGDFFIYTDSGLHSPSKNIIRRTKGTFWPEQAIDRIMKNGKLARIGFLQGVYDDRFDRPIGE